MYHRWTASLAEFSSILAGQLERLRLIEEMYRLFLEETETFYEEDIGRDLAYFFGALAIGDRQFSWQATGDAFKEIMRANVPLNHPVWKYIDTEMDHAEED
jgi:hypothetical protein